MGYFGGSDSPTEHSSQATCATLDSNMRPSWARTRRQVRGKQLEKLEIFKAPLRATSVLACGSTSIYRLFLPLVWNNPTLFQKI